ncbi:hypothetical protein HanIR_Chr04g0152031 [Helianthus annuus]|nr:hypothetical protein HanIR_Chr04g0152031 [Helianthus annuus]
MDTVATGHMQNNSGNFSLSSFNNCMSKNIIVDDGNTIPILGQGNQQLLVIHHLFDPPGARLCF